MCSHTRGPGGVEERRQHIVVPYMVLGSLRGGGGVLGTEQDVGVSLGRKSV